ncbi:SGNH/GDSL hydrolase family protein [Ramlibacter henchirensis]|uniref:SGNH/GDSL hydrolase family protein n=1 Tax=Ramlibacter henchirensis TaxID=204072 RepID=A0A4Z0C6W2_9BURK|nr:SGNH/GDSL hydrolase family protein [Ramlibacter henchirensis]TFZ06210.1 SGNH/GDSL hydrolase family protein [Ramlibacter henchirensis]
MASGWTRRGFGALTAALAAGGKTWAQEGRMFTIHTFGDSILDCARYNDRGVHPGQLIVRNDDSLFPDFRGRDVASQRPARLDHRAVDGATVEGLASQTRGLAPDDSGVALLTIGGNDLLRGLASDSGPGLRRFESRLDVFLRGLRVGPVLIGTVYDPTFGDDSRNFLGVEARVARANHRRVNEVLAAAASRHGALVDIHAHFLTGDPSWYVHTIEPSLRGASEVRRAFLPQVLAHAGLR